MNNTRLMFTLTTSESKRLIAKGMARHSKIISALKRGKIIIANGTTNAYVAEELADIAIEDKTKYTAGIITDGVACITDSKYRKKPIVLENGHLVKSSWQDVLSSFSSRDIFIKGANAVDNQGHAGILLGGSGGGTIGKALGYIQTVGASLIIPCGLEKLVPSVLAASKVAGSDAVDLSLGMKCGVMACFTADIFTEIEAISVLFGLSSTHIASGGIGDCQGSVTLITEGAEEHVRECHRFISTLKREHDLLGSKQSCSICSNKCER